MICILVAKNCFICQLFIEKMEGQRTESGFKIRFSLLTCLEKIFVLSVGLRIVVVVMVDMWFFSESFSEVYVTCFDSWRFGHLGRFFSRYALILD